ncbi:MAG: PAS domain-containing protein, partial [Planctomycetaceae bacterium]|nr:PAS domain-containing protein [Planctomycetaceae bacterium]
KDVVTPIVSQVDPEQEIRAWIPGCATGEEAYSLAILFHEQLHEDQRPLNVKIFATDVHRESLNFASAGVYSAEQLGDISAERRDRYFERIGEEYHISQELRKMIVFAPHNVITDAPFTKLHLISCRNLLIYFQPVVQKKVLSLFHFGLRRGGFLFLGSSESPGELRDEFDVLDKHWKIYRKRRDVRLPTSMRLQLSTLQNPISRQREHIPRHLPAHEGSLIEYYDALLNMHMPVAILIDEKYQLLHTFGGAEKYLQVKGGRSPVSVLEMLDDELKTAATGGLQHSKKENTQVRYSGVRVKRGDPEEQIKLTITPVQISPDKPRAFVLSFEHLEGQTTKAKSSGEEYDAKQMTREQIGALENELQFTKENLQATIEELETSNEELQATNEELVASSEELQSTNEELQSVNEELYTVNAEHQRKITELTEMTDDMSSLLESTDVGVIFLDRDLRIRRFTPRVADKFSLLPQDVGRRIDTFAHTIEAPELLSDVRQVLENGDRIEKEVVDQAGTPYFLRILPYRSQHRTLGVVLTLIEISKLREAEAGRKQAELELRQSESRKQAILDSA